MDVIRVRSLIDKRALITRDSARKIVREVEKLSGKAKVTVDFAGVDAVTPSFVDEVLSGLENELQQESAVVFLNPPTRLSEKFSAVGRAHRLDIVESGNTWIITRSLPVG